MMPRRTYRLAIRLVSALIAVGPGADATAQPSQAARALELITADGTVLKASYYAAARAGPGVLLFHQSNRTRSSWEAVAQQLAAAGIHTLTLDNRGHGDSGGSRDRWTDADKQRASQNWATDIDTVFSYLLKQPGVAPDVIGVGGAGVLGVDNCIETARRHPAVVKSLVLLSGETFQDGLKFLRQASQLPELFAVADDDEYPPTLEAMELLYLTASSPSKKLVHYSAAHEAPWEWYEPLDVGRVRAGGGHGTDMFAAHAELPGVIVDWFVTTLSKTPGHAPADTLASAAIIRQLQEPGGVKQVTEQLTDARRRDPQALLFPEITVSIIGQDHMRAGEPKLAVQVLQLNLLAYPESADAHESLAEAYLKDGQMERARQHARQALALLDGRHVPASSWSDTEPYRGEIRRAAENVLKKLDAAP